MISVLGEEELFEGFKSLRIISAKGLKLVIKKYGENDDDKKNCHVFFISQSKKQMLPKVLKDFEGASVLLIGDVPNFARLGGMINLTESKGKLGMEVNLKNSRKAGLKISSRLLRLAKIVES